MSETKYRDAVTGEYVTEDYAKSNPATTVAEHDEAKPEVDLDSDRGILMEKGDTPG